MPYTTMSYAPSNPLPQHLDHKPVYALPYEKFDGIYAGKTDARYVSIGLAQYDKYSVSIKMMRHTGEKWSRQSEEFPLHRPIDMTIFLTKAIFDSENGVVNILKGTLQNQGEDICITQEGRSDGEKAAFDNFVQSNSESLKNRLNSLRNILNSLKEQNKI